MAQLFLDQNVSQRIGPALWSSGHDVVFAGQIGAAAFTDDELLLAAVRADRVFVMHNRRDFRMLHDAWVTWLAAFGLALPPHPGILILDRRRQQSSLPSWLRFSKPYPPRVSPTASSGGIGAMAGGSQARARTGSHANSAQVAPCRQSTERSVISYSCSVTFCPSTWM